MKDAIDPPFPHACAAVPPALAWHCQELEPGLTDFQGSLSSDGVVEAAGAAAVGSCEAGAPWCLVYSHFLSSPRAAAGAV